MTLHRSVADVSTISPVRHDEAMWLAHTEYQRLSTLLSSLDASDWTRPTCCPPWTVRDMATHLLGYMRACSSPREMLRQVRLAGKREGGIVDAVSALQVHEMADLSPIEIVTEMRALIVPATRGRDGVPAIIRRVAKMTAELPVSGRKESWRLGFVVDIIGTRDVWMHRCDIGRAVGRELELTPEHDGRLIADVVREWTRRLGHPVGLTLYGPAGGSFSSGSTDVEHAYDAVEFCRLLSGRGGVPPLGTEVPF